MSEERKPDLDFIIRALNLIPYWGGALNPNEINAIDYTDTGATIYTRHGAALPFNHDQLAELAATIKRITEEGKTRRIEAIKEETTIQADVRLDILRSTVDRARQKEVMSEGMRLEAEVLNDLQGGIQGVVGAVPVPTGKRFRQ